MSMKKLIAEFRPKHKGFGKVLGSLEAEIMECVWCKYPASVKDVHEELLAIRPIAYTTVMTIMTRLGDKKLLTKTKEGNAYIYSPAVSKEEFSYSIVEEVMEGLFEGFSQETILHFVEKIGKEKEEKISDLERQLKEQR